MIKQPLYICGKVEKGRQIGRTIGFPTANLSLKANNVQLPIGVYGVFVNWRKKKYIGVMNVGIRPTFQDLKTISYEVHLVDFNESLYGETLNIEICLFVRKEKRFAKIDDLISQIRKDVKFVKKELKNRLISENSLSQMYHWGWDHELQPQASHPLA